MIDLNWTRDEANAEEFPHEAVPQRFVVTEALVITRNLGTSTELFLTNPTPEKWNHWILPFRTAMDIASDELISSLNAITNRFDAIEAAHAGSIGTAGDYPHLVASVFAISGEILFENYSLKYSHTNNKWTTYHFLYRQTNVCNLTAKVASIWVSLDELVDVPGGKKSILETPISQNVIDLLSHVGVRKQLQG